MYGWAPKSFEESLAGGVYRLPGDLSRGQSGGIAKRGSRRGNDGEPSTPPPLVSLVLDADKQPYREQRLLDLQFQSKGGQPATVRRILQSGAYGINPRQIILEDPAVRAMGPDSLSARASPS